VPFESFNLFYRDGRRQLLEQRRAEVDRSFGRRPVTPIHSI